MMPLRLFRPGFTTELEEVAASKVRQPSSEKSSSLSLALLVILIIPRLLLWLLLLLVVVVVFIMVVGRSLLATFFQHQPLLLIDSPELFPCSKGLPVCFLRSLLIDI